jgi:hypothetical protein
MEEHGTDQAEAKTMDHLRIRLSPSASLPSVPEC